MEHIINDTIQRKYSSLTVIESNKGKLHEGGTVPAGF